jgi:hypothetical protein
MIDLELSKLTFILGLESGVLGSKSQQPMTLGEKATLIVPS